MVWNGYPPTLPVPSGFRIIRYYALDATGVSFNIRGTPPADMLAEVAPHYVAADIIARAVIKQVDIGNTGLDVDLAAQSVFADYFEHSDGGAPPSPVDAAAHNPIPPGGSASYPSPVSREMTTFILRTETAPAKAQKVNVIIWFDVPPATT
jgi:hypothetical protein